MNYLTQGSALIFLTLFVIIAGVVIIERRAYYRNKDGGKYYGHERRASRKIRPLDDAPASSGAMTQMEELLKGEKIDTREGLRFVMAMMSELYIADFKRNLKINQLIEQMEIVKAKSPTHWIEKNPKMAWVLSVLFVALIVDEIRVPALQAVFKYLGIPL